MLIWILWACWKRRCGSLGSPSNYSTQREGKENVFIFFFFFKKSLLNHISVASRIPLKKHQGGPQSISQGWAWREGRSSVLSAPETGCCFWVEGCSCWQEQEPWSGTLNTSASCSGVLLKMDIKRAKFGLNIQWHFKVSKDTFCLFSQNKFKENCLLGLQIEENDYFKVLYLEIFYWKLVIRCNSTTFAAF